MALLVGCNGRQPEVASGDARSDAAAAGTHAAVGNGGVASGEDAAPAPPVQCDDLEAAPNPSEIEIVIENGRAQTVLLGPPALCQREYFKIASVSRPELQWEGINCKHGCTGAPLDEHCGADCPKLDPLPIESGETYAVSWVPLLYERVPLPEGCCAQPSGVCSRECYLPAEAAAGAHLLTLVLTNEHGDLLEQLDMPITLGPDSVSVVID